MVVIVGASLAATSLLLSDKQRENESADTMMQILASVNITPDKGDVAQVFDKYIIAQKLVSINGDATDGDALDVAMKDEIKLTPDKRSLPLFVCTLDDGSMKYIVPVYGAGLWGPIWGYIAFDSDGSTIYGAYFAHQGETPGLGAEISQDKFRNQFAGRHVFVNGTFHPIEVVKGGVAPISGADYVDGVTGGTITSKGVGAMIDNCLTPYQNFLMSLNR